MQRGFGTPATYCTAPATSVRDEEGFFLHHKIGMGLQAQGYQVRDEDAARSSPLGYGHVNTLEHYTFPAPSSAPRLRPLRDPDTGVG